MERMHAIVRGSVQGVGFRYWAATRARMMGLTGWVKNRADGAVETVAEGPAVTLGDWRNLLQQGPSHASVHSVETDISAATGEFDDFTIIR